MLIDNLRIIWLTLMFIVHIEGQRRVFFSSQTTYPTGQEPNGVASADVNGDNQTDIIVANRGSNNVSILFNQGNGTFNNQTTYLTGLNPLSVAAADLNGDNKPDLITPNYNDGTISVFLNKGNGIYANQTKYTTDLGPSFVSVDDVNGDNYLDIIVSHWGATNVAVLLNIGNGTFRNRTTYPTNSTSWGVTTGDINGDNRPDIVVPNYGSNNTGVLLNMGNGTFMTQQTYPTGYQPWAVALDDINGDNKTDIVVTNQVSNYISILLNRGNGTFQSQITYPTGTNPRSVAIADINAGNWPDIIVANKASNNIGILLNTGNGTFISQMTYSTGSLPTSVIVVDVNNDKKLDMIVANYGSNNIGVFLCIGYEEETTTLSDEVTTVQNKIQDETSTVSSTKATSISQHLSTKPIITSYILSAELTSTSQNSSTEPIITAHIPSTESTSISQNSTCFSPKIKLIPNTNLSNPISFRRSEDVSIVSVIKLHCSESLSMKTEWIIRNCTSTSCSNRIELNSTIVTTSSEIYLPSQTLQLQYGIYQFQLTVTMTKFPWLNAVKSTYVEIIPSNIIVNLFYLGTSMITSGYEEDLLLDPGRYSIDPDNFVFNANDWMYEYYCGIYGFTVFLPIQNSTCLSNRTDFLKYSNSTRSSLRILGKSLESNRSYEFLVELINRRDSSRQASGSVVVKVQDTSPPMITIGCVISSMCARSFEYQLLNPSTQVSLFSVCLGNCSSLQTIRWNIYSGQQNSSTNNSQWTLYNQTNSFENLWFFGINTKNFTSTNQLFLSNPQIKYWQFEVIYSFSSQISQSALKFVVNQPPANGSCSISPSNGTTSTSFTITCSNWFDENGIKDYSLYIWTNDYSQKRIISYSIISTLEVQLPAGDDQTGTLYLMTSIRDQFNSITEFNLSSVVVFPDSAAINELVTSLQSSSNQITNSNPIVELLSSGNQNTVGQIFISLSQQLNKMNTQTINTAVSNGTPAVSISISSLGSQRFLSSSTGQLNQSAFDNFNRELNSQANVREYLISFITNLLITTSNSIKLQSSSLAQLTQATNQLTRTTLTIASQRCYQLTLALFSMSTTISYEDAQTSATQLIQCASNIVTAVNGPLQQRTPVLALDATRATAFPSDYDTDLESEWSKLNIEGDQNTYYQKQLANQIQSQMNELISKLTSTLNIYLNVGQQSILNTSQVFMSLQTQSMQSLTNQQIQQVGNAAILLPSTFQTNTTSNSTVSIRSMMQPLAIAGNSESSANTNLSRSISLSILDQYGTQVLIQANQTHPIEMMIPRDPNLIVPSMILQNVTSTDSTPHQQLFHFHYVNLSSSLPISIHIEIHPLNTSIAYLFIYKFDQIPQLNESIYRIDGWTILCPLNLSNDSIYTYFLDNQFTQNHQSLVFGLRELNSSESVLYCSNSSRRDAPITNQRYNFTSNYQLRVYSSGCYYLDENNQWNGEGLRVGSLTNHQQTQCFSSHLTTFAGGFLVLPEPVNWQYVFANANFMKNKTIYLTVICVSLIYPLVLIYARYKDKKDLEQLGVIRLSDNDPSDRYFYQILVFTGHRKDSGTKSQVQFVLAGDQDQTQIRTFTNSKREIFQRSGIDGFVMSVRRYLGPLNYLHIWHDNSGKGSSASWFLKYLIVRDLQTMEISYFIAQRWFAVEKDDGKIERLLPVASEIEKNEFIYLLSKKAYHKISDDHLWFSIFSRPPSNQFSRVQRCTCCFVLFFLSMFLNIMYYDLSNETKTNNSTDNLRLGPFVISREQIGIGVIVEFLAFIPSLFIVQIFRRLRLRGQPKTKTKLTFSWWLKFVAYGFCLVLLGVSIFFIIVRGIEFGDLKTQQWLTSIVTSFFSSFFLSQPIKIVCLSIFFSSICRKSNYHDEQAEQYFLELDQNQEYFPNKSHSIYHSSTQSNRLTENELIYARNQRIKDVQMWSFLRETFIYLTFVCLLFLLTYSNRTTDPYLQVQHLQNYFDIDDMSTIDEYWNWLEESFVENVRAQQWYNGDQPRYLSGYMNDKTNRLIGWATMRQLRVKSDLCPYRKWISRCQEDFSLSNEERQSFELGWTNVTLKKGNTTIEQAFQYQTKDELDSYTIVGDHGKYPGDGYVYEFRGRLSDVQSNLSMLHKFQWIDKQTRAIIIQFNLYNPNVHLLTSVLFLNEFLSTGGLQTTSQFDPIDFSVSLTSTSQLIFLILYLIFIFYFMFIEIESLFRLKRKYFHQFWPIIDLGVIVCSWMGFALYIYRYKECLRISQLFSETNGYVYINLQYLTYLNQFLTFMYGFSCFFGTMKMIRLFRFNSRIYLFISTLQSSAKELFGFALMFAIVFVAYMSLFYLLFSSKLWSASSLFQTAEMLFEIILMKFDAHQLISADAFLGPFAFSLFIFVGVFVCLSMFMTIINQNFRRAKQNEKKNEEFYSLIWKRFVRWTGLKKATKEEIHEEYNAMMRIQYHDSFGLFEKRIDELLQICNRIYMDQHK